MSTWRLPRVFLPSLMFILLFSIQGASFEPKKSSTDLDAKQFSLPELTINNSAISYDDALRKNLSTRSAWEAFVLQQRVNGQVVAKRKGNATIDPDVFYNVVLSYNGTQFQLTVDGVPLLNLVPVGVMPNGTVGYQVKKTTVNVDSINVN